MHSLASHPQISSFQDFKLPHVQPSSGILEIASINIRISYIITAKPVLVNFINSTC